MNNRQVKVSLGLQLTFTRPHVVVDKFPVTGQVFHFTNYKQIRNIIELLSDDEFHKCRHIAVCVSACFS